MKFIFSNFLKRQTGRQAVPRRKRYQQNFVNSKTYFLHFSNVSSVTRLGDFWKFLHTNLLTNVAIKDCWLLGYFEKVELMKNCYGYILGNLWKQLGNFLYPNIWSQWSFPTSNLWTFNPRISAPNGGRCTNRLLRPVWPEVGIKISQN